MAKPKKGNTVANQPCNKCQQPTQQLMAASSPFYTCNNPECAFYLPVESDPKEAATMADVELLPLPEYLRCGYKRMPADSHESECKHYARANLAQLQVENERLRAEVETGDTNLAAAMSAVAELEARAERLAEALRWYAEQARLCRKFGSEGDAARHALSADGGKRANRALTQENEP